MISVRQKTNFRRLESFLKEDYDGRCKSVLTNVGARGFEELKAATPVNTGLTRDSWDYAIVKTETGYRLVYSNSNLTSEGLPLVVLLEYGHGTRSGGYVPGKYFISKTLNPIHAELKSRLKTEVIKS